MNKESSENGRYQIFNLNEGNIYYDKNWCGPFHQLCEYAYLKGIFVKLEDLFGDSFGDYDYYIYSSNGVYNPPKPIIITNDKPRILFYISDEQSTVPQHLKKYFKIIFKQIHCCVGLLYMFFTR